MNIYAFILFVPETKEGTQMYVGPRIHVKPVQLHYLIPYVGATSVTNTHFYIDISFIDEFNYCLLRCYSYPL